MHRRCDAGGCRPVKRAFYYYSIELPFIRKHNGRAQAAGLRRRQR